MSPARPGGWHRSPAGFLGRVLQAADESNLPFLASALTFDALLAAVPFILLILVGLTYLAQSIADSGVMGGEPAVDVVTVLRRFFPQHAAGADGDPFAQVEQLLTKIANNRGQLSLYAAPAFLWFSTRLFAGVRTALNEVFDVSVRPPPPRGVVLSYLLDKLRDVGMVLATVVLFFGNTVLTTGLALLQALGAEQAPRLGFFVTSVGRLLGEVLTFGFSVSLFYVVYKHASVRRLPWRTALLASTFSALLFEAAKRLYGLYLANFASLEQAGGDANLGAAVLFVLWVWYTAIVFLLGAVVGETWELRALQRRQRARLA